MKLSYKIFFVILAVTIVVIILTNVMFSMNTKRAVVSGISDEAFRIATETADMINRDDEMIDAYAQLHSDRSDKDSLKVSINSFLREIRKEYAQNGVENVYSIMLIKDQLLIAGDPSEESEPILSQKDHAHIDVKKSIFSSGKGLALDEPYTDEYGVWISAYAPIKNKQKETLAIIGIDLPLGAYNIIDTQVNKTLLYTLIPCAFLSGLLSFLVSRNLSNPINQIVSSIEKLTDGQLETRILFDRKDEIGTIGSAFNRMAEDLEGKEKIKSILNSSVSSVIAQKLLKEDISPSGELFEGTVLFADIRGFTRLTETIAARDTIAYINSLMNLSVPIIQKNGGIIEKFIGDEIFAVFGGPQPLHNDAEMAVRSALAIQEEINELNVKNSSSNLPILNVGIGICTGMLVGGVIGTESRNNYTLLGTTVNQGARLCGLANTGEVIINQSTFLRVQNSFSVEKQTPEKIKGQAFDVLTFKVNGVKSTNHNA